MKKYEVFQRMTNEDGSYQDVPAVRDGKPVGSAFLLLARMKAWDMFSGHFQISWVIKDRQGKERAGGSIGAPKSSL